MKATITIHFIEIAGQKVDDAMMKKNPALIGSTRKTIKALCSVIEKYFREKRIKVIAQEIVDGGELKNEQEKTSNI